MMFESDLFSRRNFLGAATGVASSIMLTRESLALAQDDKPKAPVNLGLIGAGQHGQLLLARLARVPGANVVAIADSYEPILKRASEAAPKATTGTDYRAVLEKADAVIIATPTCDHKQITLDALAADKHVYLEAPLATTLADAQAIARSGNASKQVFMAGLHQRANKLYRHSERMAYANMIGRTFSARAQFHRKFSWRRPAPTAAAERQLNWKTDKARSTGLVGEFGTHQIDTISWFFKRPPAAVIALGANKVWDDGREVHDVVHAIFEYSNDRRVVYEATIGNSFDASYELIFGDMGSMCLRTDRAWLIKEADSPVQGWEVYAKVEKLVDEEGIQMVADATKLLKENKDPAKFGAAERAGKDAYYDAMEEFLDAVRENRKPIVGAKEGLQATVVGIRANEAIWSGNKTAISVEDWTL